MAHFEATHLLAVPVEGSLHQTEGLFKARARHSAQCTSFNVYLVLHLAEISIDEGLSHGELLQDCLDLLVQSDYVLVQEGLHVLP